jgi:hypothetical protein
MMDIDDYNECDTDDEEDEDLPGVVAVALTIVGGGAVGALLGFLAARCGPRNGLVPLLGSLDTEIVVSQLDKAVRRVSEQEDVG